MVVPQLQASSDASGESPKVFLDGLADRFESFESSGFFDCVDAQALGGAAINTGKDRYPAFGLREGSGSIGTSHPIRRDHHNRSCMR